MQDTKRQLQLPPKSGCAQIRICFKTRSILWCTSQLKYIWNDIKQISEVLCDVIIRMHQEDDLHKRRRVSSGPTSARPAAGKALMHLLVSDWPHTLCCCHEVSKCRCAHSVSMQPLLTSPTDVFAACCNTGWFFLWTVSSCGSWRFCHLPAWRPTTAPPLSHGKQATLKMLKQKLCKSSGTSCFAPLDRILPCPVIRWQVWHKVTKTHNLTYLIVITQQITCHQQPPWLSCVDGVTGEG